MIIDEDKSHLPMHSHVVPSSLYVLRLSLTLFTCLTRLAIWSPLEIKMNNFVTFWLYNYTFRRKKLKFTDDKLYAIFLADITQTTTVMHYYYHYKLYYAQLAVWRECVVLVTLNEWCHSPRGYSVT